jgi:hypothetical protein
MSALRITGGVFAAGMVAEVATFHGRCEPLEHGDEGREPEAVCVSMRC